jgi:hypothetical protein
LNPQSEQPWQLPPQADVALVIAGISAVIGRGHEWRGRVAIA